ncbi:helix-turn-helix domain-containing protein [Phocaeicola dorei]|uniref:helix-turn-helix domain-containing protein n=1 Tax=Phocaeicola dorei TaxID=357276 RepID=UPI001BDED763|nr:helix-turn-helix domain-containing protein [Phocaeicola dorei]MBT1310241.1 helix-turn-helix domain-containing protein [Phocaeicola dorei]MBT1314927.1 helix-turn-helix domain-containing protein [Phocaeicola dorei]
MLQINSESAQMMFMQIMERFDRIDRTLERMNKLKECLKGDTLLDNYDLCQLLGITKRTLARYRQKKYVTYYMIDGRTYYKASEVEAFLNQKGKVLPANLKNRTDVQLKK